MIHILRSRATPQQMAEMLQYWELAVKLAVDVERQVIAGGGELHSDCEAALLDDGSQQENIWGATYFPETTLIRFDSVINIRSRDQNYTRELQHPLLRQWIAELVKNFLEEV
ncbi:MAG: DUF5674 family protein [Blastocatellia bacterium]